MELEVKVVRVSSEAKLPEKSSKGAACFDLRSSTAAYLPPHRVTIIPTGLKMEIPEGYYMEFSIRSSLAKLGLCIANSPAVIDSDYRGEVKIIIFNLSPQQQSISPGEKIAQCKIREEIPTKFREVDEEDLSFTERGEGGFGSTGRS